MRTRRSLRSSGHPDHRLAPLTEQLALAGFISAGDEAQQLLSHAGHDPALLADAVARRSSGEPLAWITGSTLLCGSRIHVHRGVYVPRWNTEPLAARAVERLPADGIAIDVCTGSGAIARIMAAARPRARVVATDIDAHAVACARANGVDAVVGDLFDPVPLDLQRQVDVVVGIVPYVPTAELSRLQRDTFTFESETTYDGGEDGLAILRRVIHEAPMFLRPGGALLLEAGGDQDVALTGELTRHGFRDVVAFVDEDGDLRGIESTLEA